MTPTDSMTMPLATFTVHGEILNARSIALELGLDALTPLAAVLEAGWRRWSVELFARLDGVFSLVLNEDASTVLYRDPSGLSQLYWRQSAGHEPRVATCLRALFDTDDMPPRLCRHALHEYLRFLDIAAPRTIFEGVHAVEAGRWVRIPAQGAVESGQLRRTDAEPPAEHLSEAVNELEQRLQTSIRTRLADSTRAAAFLSGGIDSSLICALTARFRPDLTSVTVGFDGNAFDETPMAQHIAAHLGLKHQVLRFTHQAVLSALDQLAAQMDQPMADPAAPATLLAFDACRESFDAVLDGTGADESVGALPPRHVRVAVSYGSAVPAAMRRTLVKLMRRIPRVADYSPILDFEHPADTLSRWRGFTRTEIEELCAEPVSLAGTSFYRTFAAFPRHAHFERFSALQDVMPADRLNQATRISGLRVRFPFADRAVDAYLRGLPIEWRHAAGQPKRILRVLLGRHVPDHLWDMPKRGFTFPLADFLAADNFALVRRHLHSGLWQQRGLLRPDIVRRHADAFIAGDRRPAMRIWALVMLSSWLEHHPTMSP